MRCERAGGALSEARERRSLYGASEINDAQDDWLGQRGLWCVYRAVNHWPDCAGPYLVEGKAERRALFIAEVMPTPEVVRQERRPGGKVSAFAISIPRTGARTFLWRWPGACGGSACEFGA